MLQHLIIPKPEYFIKNSFYNFPVFFLICMMYCLGILVIFWAGLRFEEIARAEVWHGDVRVFSVFDLGSNELLGYCYLDLFSRLSICSYLKFLCSIIFFVCHWKLKLGSYSLFYREGKYGHTCMVPLQNSALTINGTRQVFILFF